MVVILIKSFILMVSVVSYFGFSPCYL